MHESSYDDCGCCADVHFGALLNQTSRLIRRALDARINAEVNSEPVSYTHLDVYKRQG